ELEETKRHLGEQAEIITTLTHDQPPSITLAETDERFLFPFGSAEISPTFREGLLQEIVSKILDAKRKYHINTIQLIGHTNEAPLRKSSGNLDYNLIAFIGSDAVVTPGSNTDLAMLRAVAVLKVLREHAGLKDMKLVPYSAGQILLPEPEDTLSS